MHLKTIKLINLICNYSVCIPAIIGIIRFKHLDKYCRFFVLLTIFFVFSELVFAIKYGPQLNNFINYLIIFFESLMILYLLILQLHLEKPYKLLFTYTVVYFILVALESKLLGLNTYRGSAVCFVAEAMECLILTKIFLMRIFKLQNKKSLFIEWLLMAPLILVTFNLVIHEPITLLYFYYIPIDPPYLLFIQISLFSLNLLYNISTTIAFLWIPAKPAFIKAS